MLETEALIPPNVDKRQMVLHLKQISAKTEAGRHAFVIMDGAGRHQASSVGDISNVSIMKLPSYFSVLNLLNRFAVNYVSTT